ncbi:MAG: pirin family protein [Candidatus Heimdallarchaeota archaeon]|nr:pirin family protein [Candidatus Heimdallarchaeota archaeon]
MQESIGREIKYVAESVPAIDGAGVRLRRAFGNLQGINLDPFLLLDNFHSDDPKDYSAGFPWHPHRGIETVTYMLNGKMRHEDSLGNKGDIKAGEIQWMTAGSGIIHQEMPQQKDGLIQGFQLWVNLPKTNKMMQPRYQDVKHHEIPELKVDNDTKIRILAGEFQSKKGPVQEVVSNPNYMDVTVNQETKFNYHVEAEDTVIVYTVEGSAYFDKTKQNLIPENNLVVFGPGDEINIETNNELSRFLLMSGKPIREPVAWHGPMVMNTREEIIHAFEEFQNGTFIKHKYRV